MRYFKIQRSLQAACAVVLLSAVASFADPAPTPGNPDTNASDKNFDTNQPNTIGGGLQKAEDGGNRALNHVDRGTHKAIHKTKRGAHKVKKGAHNAADSVKDSYNDRVEPAKS